MESLAGRAATMAWDWDADDIDADENDGKQWVPIMPQTIKIAETPRPPKRVPTTPMTPTPGKRNQQMTMYALHLTRSGLAEQASLPIVIPVLSPNRSGPIIVKENVGEGARQGDEETTTDDPGESELTEQSSMPKV